MFVAEAILLGLGLSMDAAAVGMADGLKEPKMRAGKLLFIALLFGLFQGLMPFIGYGLGSVLSQFLEGAVPYIAFVILTALGIKMIVEATKKKADGDARALTWKVLLLQAVATSMDALAVGVVYLNRPFARAALVFVLIAATTFATVTLAVFLGKKFGNRNGKTAEIIGGCILIIIGLKILVEFLVGTYCH